MFPSVSPKQSFPALESEVLAYWKANNTFQRSIDTRPEDSPYRFYDGPPFITGKPHYGSLLSSIVKDVVGRYWTMRGRRVDRTWGWDCHGLPIEEKVQKKLGLKSNKDIEENGVKKFIDECYAYTSDVSSEWNWYIDKIGRWVDMDNAYRTMDQDYMESVMWVFSELWKKGLIYEGKRVSLYSWKLGTPISNFEVAMDDTYQEVNDPAITVKFALEQDTRCIDKKEWGKFEYTTDWYLRYVLAVIKNDKWEYFMLKNKKHGGKWQCPGGKIDAWETAKDALQREVMEELNVECMIWDEISEKKIIVNGTMWQGEYYEVTLHGTPTIQEINKHEKMEWVRLENWESGYILTSETEKSDDQNFIRENFDIWNLVTDRPNIHTISVLAWTTTPWTIPANMALAVRNDIDYVLVENTGEWYIVAKNRLETVFKGKWEYSVIRELKGSELVGLGYIPPFPEYYYQKNGDKNHKIYHADFITDTDGTGIGHEAPEFGEVDFQLAKKEGIHISHAMDDAGRYSAEIFDFEWTHYLDLENPENGANKINIERMRANNTLFKLEGITHRVPFCPRSGTPLMQKAQKSWFIDIQSQKDKLIEANEQINWFPEYLKEWRFKKGIEAAPDWCISRTRYWGAPMPVWIGEDGEKIVVSSREEIYEANKPYGQLEAREVEGKTVYYFKWGEYDGVEFNLHKPYIDSVLLKNPKATKAKKVLGVHGRWSDINKKSWLEKKNVFEKSGMSLDLFQFDQSEDPTYQSWKEVFDTIDFSQYDAIYTSSLGGVMTVRYLTETGKKVPRIVMVAPWISNKVGAGLKPNVQSIFDSLESFDIKNISSELIVLHAQDDEITPYNNGKSFAESLDAKLVTVEKGGHSLENQYQLIAGLVQYGSPMTRIPEVLDVWLDSGSMPYAQMHYPFEKKEAMQASFPADFIAEYVWQLRAWFYVMHVLGVLLNPTNQEKPTPSFTNVITTGVVNGNDGRKMSKSFGNYPDPRMAIEKYGADPIRFYMLNSPLLSGGDMDFKEEGIMETIKGVMLPIWNTYSFFTTYANIDKWEHDETEIVLMRHGETETNATNGANGWSTDTGLTQKWREQAMARGKEFKQNGKEFDVMIVTPVKRTHETAKIVADEIGFHGIIEEMSELVEQHMGEAEWRNVDELKEEWVKEHGDDIGWTRIYRENSQESFDQFTTRVEVGLRKLQENYRGKKILIVAHAGTARAMSRIQFWQDKDTAMWKSRTLENCGVVPLINTPIFNPLDQWILSKLQVLIVQVHDAMEGYDVSRGCRAIVDYMDELTNWYVRLSRRRFWESGMTADKQSAYETLYTVLTEVSKLMAPLMPFLSENIYQGLTERESVHLEYITLANRHLVANDLNRDMEICEHIVSLGLALRSRKNIRVRQPLASVTITRELSDYYKQIIRDELNVKEVRYENPENLAKKICKPDARKIGPKYGKDVQKVITEAKNGNFVEKENGIIDVGGFILEPGEYIMEYLPLEGTLDVEGGYGMVVALDTTIIEDLRLEGYARDIIRLIQDMRKEADYQVTDRITLSLSGEGSEGIVATFGDMIASETLSTFADISTADVEKTESIDEGIVLMLRVAR